MLEVRHLTKRYDRVLALDDVSFRVKEHQVMGLLGVNGAGKTTALSIITGCMPPGEGQVLLNGMDMQEQPRACRRLIGFLPEEPPLYNEMTVEEYLRFVCRLREVEKTEIPEHVEEILEKTALKDMRRRILGHLSRGYRQRAGIAQALCGAPPVLVLDEPTVGLDPRQVTEIREMIMELGKEHTVLFSSHILTEVQQICSGILILHQGRLIHEADMSGLEDGAEKQTYTMVVLETEGDVPAAIRSIPGVRKVRGIQRGEGRCRMTVECSGHGDDVRVRIFHLLSSMNAPILQLSAQRNSLEDVFLRVTGEGEAKS